MAREGQGYPCCQHDMMMMMMMSSIIMRMVLILIQPFFYNISSLQLKYYIVLQVPHFLIK